MAARKRVKYYRHPRTTQERRACPDADEQGVPVRPCRQGSPRGLPDYHNDKPVARRSRNDRKFRRA